jgi:hypothetical protein
VITNTDDMACGNQVAIIASDAVSVTVNAVTAPNPVPTPNPTPEPEPTPNPDPEPESSEITVNGQAKGITVGSDGALRITFTNEDVERFSDNSGTFNVEVSNHINIMTFISISALKTDSLSIKTDFGIIHIPSSVLTEISAMHGDMLRLVIKKGSLYVILLDEDENEIAYFDPANPFRITLPYELEDGQLAGVVVAIGADGNIIPFAVFKDGFISFGITQTGWYDVLYNHKTFTDVSDHWAEDYIDFVAARALYLGIGGDLFDTGGDMTRAMFVQVLANLEGADLSLYTACRFTDVSDSAWYMAAVEWAAELGIVSGIGGDKFNPNAPITREQMAVMLWNYIQYKGFELADGSYASAFEDEDIISSWALDAVKAIQSANIVHGRPGNYYDPDGTATRAEVAAVFARFVEIAAFGDNAGAAS